MKMSMKTLLVLFLMLMLFISFADEQTVDGYKWIYRVEGDCVEIYRDESAGSCAIYPKPAGALTIPSKLGGKTVMGIGYGAFRGCSGLTSVTIPDGVTSIGSSAFSGCSGLTSVTIPDSVMNIGKCAFVDCSGIETFLVAENNLSYKSDSGLLLTRDGTTLVSGVKGDTRIPEGVKNISERAFSSYSALTSVTIPDSVTNIGEAAFYSCSGLKSVTIPDSVTSFGGYAFSCCSGLTSVTISNGVTSIGEAAFYYCSGLTSVTIPDSVTSIGDGAFYHCSGLTSVAIGNGVTSIGKSAFSCCSGLTSVTIPGSVTSIGDLAFSYCSGLTSVAIPGSVTSIGGKAFSYCSGLTSVTIPGSVTSIGDLAFYGCTNVCDATVPGWMCRVPFDRITNLVISAGTKSIGSSAFSGCIGLTSVTIPDSVASIGDHAFSGCGGLKSVTIPDSVTSIGNQAFYGCNGLADAAGFVIIRDVVYDYCGADTSVMMPDGVTSIGSSAFSGCIGLTSVTIPDSVASIGDHAFSGCGGLKSVTIPNSVTSIGNYAFSDCSGLTRVFLPLEYNGALDTLFPSSTDVIRYKKLKQQNVTFDANSGDVQATVKVVDYGMPYGALPLPSRIGYTFRWWLWNEQLINSESIVEALDDHTLVAQWKINQYKITFNANGGSDGKSVTQDYDTALTAPTVTRTGYTFNGWSPSVPSTVPASNVTYIAQWRINQYEVTFDGNGGALGEGALPSVTNIQDYGSEIVAPTATREGYTFAGWQPEVDATVPASNVTYTAQWRINQYEVAFDANGGDGSVTNEQCYASEIVAPEVSREGYTFVGWFPAVDATVPASNVIHTAQWKVNLYEVGFDGDGGALGESALPRIVMTQDYGTAIVAPTATREWCTFAGWQPALLETVPARDVSYTAQWRRWGDSISASKMGGKTMKQLYPNDYAYMTTVVLEEGITKLPTGFFNGCGNVEFVTWPSTLVEFGIDDLPSKIRASLAYDADGFIIYNGWLLGCQDKNASSLVVPEGIVGIGAGALAGMYDLETVSLPQSLKYIATGAFQEDTYLDNLVIPDGVEIIGESAFEDCSYIQTLTLGKGVKSVGARAFAGCTQLSGAVFADGLLDVGAEAFNGCWRMQSVSLPLSTTNVASSVFTGCTSLTGVTVPTHGGRMSEWFAPVYSQIRDVTVPAGETKVRASMFEGCGSLRTVQMPDSIKNIAARAFYGCSSLPGVRLPESLLTIGDEAFRNCSSLTAAALPETVTSIGTRAFQDCSNLSALTLPRGLESLPDYVFADCRSLDSFVVPAAVTTLGNYIVSSYTIDIYYLGNAPAYGANVYGSASGSLKSYVILGTKGWDGRPNSRDIPASWNGRDILTWSANQFDVTFDANGGLFSLEASDTYICEETTSTGYVLPPVDPVRAGMDFDGYWTEQSGGTRIFTSTRVLLTKQHTLYAHWIANTSMKLTLKASNSKYGTVTGGGDYLVDMTATLKAKANSGNAFAGWFTDKACTKPLNPDGYDNRSPTVKIVMPAKDTTIYAKFVTAAEAKKSLKFSSATAKLATTAAKATAGSAFSLKLGISSATLVTVTATGLPKGLKIDKATGAITGTATVPGDFTATVTVKDAAGNIISQKVKMTIEAAAYARGDFYGTAKSGKKGDPTAYLQFTVAKTGKVSGKVNYKGKAYSFTSAYMSCTAAKATFAPKVKIGKTTFKPGTVTVKTQKVGGLSLVEAANSKGTFAAQKKPELVKKGKALAKLVGKTFKFTKKTKNSGLTKSKDKIEVKLANGDAVKVAGIVGGKKLTAISWVTLVSSKATKSGSEVYTLYVDIIDAALKYERTLVIKATVSTGGVKATAAFAK